MQAYNLCACFPAARCTAPFIFQKHCGEGERHSTKQLRDETLPLKRILLQNMLSQASAEDRDVKVKNTKYANHRSVDQSHQNHAIRAEATSSCFPWQMYFYHRQAERLKVPVKSHYDYTGRNGCGIVQSEDKHEDDCAAACCGDASIVLNVLAVFLSVYLSIVL